MYLKTTKRRYKGKTYTSYLLVESVSTPKGPRQRTVCSLGDLKPRPRSAWLKLVDRVEDALVGQGDLFDPADDEMQAIVAKVKAYRARRAAETDDDEVISVSANEVETEEHREGGTVHVGHEFWKRLGLDEILRDLGLSERMCALVCVLIMNRLIDPKAEYAIPDWVRRTALGDILGADFTELAEDALYRAMDKVHPHRAAIESALVERESEVFNLDRTVFFYDLTSTYFEGLAKSNGKTKRGHSRDKRRDCKQVIVGMVVNRDGFPLFHEVFEGNTQDRATLKTMLDSIDARVGIEEGQTVVVDRGMAYEENIEQLRAHPKNLKYIVATRQSERDRFLDDFEDLEGFEEAVRAPSPTNPFQKSLRFMSMSNSNAAAARHTYCAAAPNASTKTARFAIKRKLDSSTTLSVSRGASSAAI